MATKQVLEDVKTLGNQFIPGVNYSNYFKSLKAAATKTGNTAENATIVRYENAWNEWYKTNTIGSSTSKLSKAELETLANRAQSEIDNQVKALNSGIADWDAASKAAKGTDAKNAVDSSFKTKLNTALYAAEDAALNAQSSYSSAANATQTDIDKAAQDAYAVYKATGKLPEGLTSATATAANKLVADYQTTQSNQAAAQNAFEQWKKTGLDPSNLTIDAKAAYDVLKNKSLGVATGPETPTAPKAPVFSTATDLAGALKDYGRQGLLPDRRANAPLYNQLLDYIAAGKTDTTQTQAAKPTNVQVQLPQDYGTRMAVQDRMAANALNTNNQGMYAPGQFDPYYSGFMMSRANTPVVPQGEQNTLDPVSGARKYGPLTASPFQGFGIQNAYDPGSSPQTTTGAAAGGYMDAQTVAQQNQQLQQPQSSYSLGLGAIPNMTQYTNYTGNPGISTPTQGVDDGSVGGVPVPGQTNPVW